MKARFLALAALVLGLASCQNDFEGGGIATGGEVGFKLSVAAPELAGTRAGEDGKADDQNAMDSAFGAIDYLQGAATGDYRQDWGDVDIRYVLEVYDKADDYTGKTPVKDRQVIIKDSYEPVVFELRLIPKREYHFVVFADFVKDGSADLDSDAQLKVDGLRHKIGSTLAEIEVIGENINDEAGDAYFATKDITVDSSATQDIVLKRPYGKLRVIATDLAELNLNVHPASVSVEYEEFNPNSFNAVTGTIGGQYTTAKRFVSTFVNEVRDNMASHYYNTGYDAKKATALNGTERHTHMTLFTDYILAIPDGQGSVHFTMRVNDGKGGLIKETEFFTEIPIERNHLTTIIGNVLTTATEVEVRVDDNFANVDDDDTTNDHNFTLLEVLMNGGKFTLTEDMTITEPTNLKGNAIIDLNDHTLNYVASKDDNKHAIMTRVEDGSSLRFIGEGEVKSTGYIASANEGGTIYITEGKFTTTGCTLFQANGGEVYISGGEFKAAEYNGDYRFTLNHVDSMKKVGLIEVSGGKFYMYDPSKSASENPAMNFVKDGFGTTKEGDYYVVAAANDYVDKGTYMEVYTAKGLAKWAYTVNNVDGKKEYGVKLMADITLPQYALVADAANETYMFDETQPIDSTNSNWIPVCGVINDYPDAFSGDVMGEGHTISGLCINKIGNYTGFIGFMYDGASIKNLTFVDAIVNGMDAVDTEEGQFVGVAAGRAQDDTIIELVNVVSSTVSGYDNVGAIVGRNYSRVGGAMGQGYTEGPAIVKKCATDASTMVNCPNGYNIGGIVGYNYGATIIECENHADVTGVSSVGGIVGYTRDYHHNKDGYIVACCSYDDATITATNGSVGGIAGHTLTDNNHTNTYMHLVACGAFSKIEGKSKGCIIGTITPKQHTAGCVAVKNGAEKLYGSGTPSTEAGVTDAILYDAANGATQADVDALNEAIAHYNSNNPPQEAMCNYKWVLNNDFPVLLSK
ncbi:MAG: hypothetical protein IJZ78_00290 [Alistipes sp.]|nr:hypothetical protein [Alistipes sp.]